MSSSVHVDNKKTYIFILGEGPTQGLDDTTLTVEKQYSINFIETRTKFCRQTVIYSLMVSKFVNLNQNILKLMQFNYVQETFQKTFL